MSALADARVIFVDSAPSLTALLDQLSRLEAAAHSNAVEQTRINTLIHELTSHLAPSNSPSLSDIFADVGYEILHSLLPLVSPDSIRPTAAGESTVRDVADSVLTCTVLYGSPREVFLPLLSHLSAHITPLAQQQEEKQQPIDERKQQPTVEPPSLPYVLFLLPYFVCLLQREKHVARQASMFKSLSSLLAAFFAALPTDEALTALLSPMRSVLRRENEVHVGWLLSLLASYLPPHYRQPSSQPALAFSLLMSLLPDTSTAADFHLAALTTYLRRRQSLTEQLSTMRQQSWEITEDEENLTRVQHESWHAAGTADDEADDEEEQDEEERTRRSELRQTKAQLAALPPYPPAGIVCLVLLRLVSENKRDAEHLVRGEQGGVAGLRVYVDAMLSTDLAGRNRHLLIDFFHHWLSLLLPQSLNYTQVPQVEAVDQQTRDDRWMLAECITTLMMQPPPSTARPANASSTAAATTTATSILPLYLSRFNASSRSTLTAVLIPACPFPAIQAVLVSTLKDLLLTDSSEQRLAVVLELLRSLLAQWSDVSIVLERVDGLMAVLNVLRFAVLHFVAPQLSDDRRRQLVAGVRLMQQRVSQAEERENEQVRKAVDLPVLLLKNLTERVLEII